MLPMYKKYLMVLAITAANLMVSSESNAQVVLFSNQTGELTGGGASVDGLAQAQRVNQNSGQDVAVTFTPLQNANFYDISLGLVFSGEFPQSTNHFTVQLMSDANGHPGSVIESLTNVSAPGVVFTGQPPVTFATPLLTLSSTLHPSLSANTPYWIAAFPGDTNADGFWAINYPQDTLNDYEFRDSDFPNWSPPSSETCSLKVRGTVVPEPGSIAMLTGMGLASACFLARRRKIA